MSKTAEFFFDFGSPTTYLAATQLPRIAAETGAELRWRPMLLGGVFKATGNQSPVLIAAKGRWMMGDIVQWAAHWRVPFAANPYFPINTLTLMRGAVALQRFSAADFDRYAYAVFEAMWVGQRNLGDAAELERLLAAVGIDPAAFAGWVADPAVKAALIANTEEAVERGAFGAPSIFVGDRLFFGQDRLDFVRQALLRG
ncbi:2-hydroxychromene-2-carboxylate isomerase [Aquincola sp. S2]|uniref:2-hydroxychromene-2-carboxylate isomerase n=1 Tax=Pseudaquabacterium terrae TaxID=2732868 RepID=A0ABX2EER6_9BURK|nr:2-hydroxychromene-2-carboxylate isomerase [Aquabacterium terrae]NRF67113.1 2-hydroxychromene-2-carboxylate isomerase [Aquabacterium terrae]